MASTHSVYFGTYTTGWSCTDNLPCQSEGIYRSEYSPTTGRLSAPLLVGRLPNPSYLQVHPESGRLYAVSEIDDFEVGSDTSAGQASGSVAAFEPAGDELRLINQVSSGGGSPCHLSFDHAGKVALVSNYGGSIASLLIASDGSLRSGHRLVAGGSGPHPRQDGPHPHCIQSCQRKGGVYAVDLGTDQLTRYEVLEGGQLKFMNSGNSGPGRGPRHLALHPNGHVAYVVNELDSTLSVYRLPNLAAIQTLSSLPAGATGDNLGAAVRLSPDARYVYVSNRGHDNIATFAVRDKIGRLSTPQFMAAGGSWPRDIVLSPNGKHLLAINKKSGNVAVFQVDPSSGQLSLTQHGIELSQPVCAVFGASRN